MSKSLRYLEVGVCNLFKQAFPDQTDFFYTGTRLPGRFGPDVHALTPSTLWTVMQRLRRREYDLVVVHPPLYAAWHPRSFISILKERKLSYSVGLFSTFAYNFLRFVRETPMAVVDVQDSFSVGRHNLFLFDRAPVYYKRELPQDNWLVFFGTAHRNLPGGWFRKSPKFQRYTQQLRPFGIGVGEQVVAAGQKRLGREKTTDIFYAGATFDNNTVRTKGLKALQALRDKGVRVDLPEGRLPYDEFLDRCASAWLVWSPAGLGWECFRHYEAPLMGTVPVINSPTIERHRPLEHGEHCFHYSIEGNGLANTVLTALEDKPRLVRMAAAAREHVIRYHTYAGLGRHILEAALPAHFPTAAIPRRIAA